MTVVPCKAPLYINSRGCTVVFYEEGGERVIEKTEIVRVPNLPQGRVSVAISPLPVQDVFCIAPPPVCPLPQSMQRHADLQLCHLDGKYILAAPEVYDFYCRTLSPYGFEILCGETHIGSTYPQDAAYNIARVGNVAFHNPDVTDPVALRFFKEHAIRVIAVRQGYAKCAVLPVDAQSLITADKGIAHAAISAGFSVLEIAPGGITLSGFSYGFLGGAAGKLNDDTIYVTGALCAHPSYLEIFEFLQKRGIKIQEGSIPIPIDIGSVIPLVIKK